MEHSGTSWPSNNDHNYESEKICKIKFSKEKLSAQKMKKNNNTKQKHLQTKNKTRIKTEGKMNWKWLQWVKAHNLEN